MCGISGIYAKSKNYIISDNLIKMTKLLGHRGPDDFGYYSDDNCLLGHSRLKILDINGSSQPIYNETNEIIVIYNGEIYNHQDLRKLLLERGHEIEGRSDSSIIPHLFEEYGIEFLNLINGQYAICIYDKKNKDIFLIRDRFGEKPLYYSSLSECVIFSSEMKSMIETGLVKKNVNMETINEIFTYWVPISPNTIYENIKSVEPGCYIKIAKDFTISKKRYWRLTFRKEMRTYPEKKYIDNLDELLQKSIEARLQCDTKIGFFLSGGLDSSLIIAIASNLLKEKLDTYSIQFSDKEYDESSFQKILIEKFNCNNTMLTFGENDFTKNFIEMMYYIETPILRPGPVPLFLLTKEIKKRGVKVVLSGEGADELFGGYDIFQEVVLRDNGSRNYNLINNFQPQIKDARKEILSLYYTSINSKGMFPSHENRWKLGYYMKPFLKEYKEQAINKFEASLNYSTILALSNLQKAQFLEISTLLSEFLLSSQGDRVSMANSVEVRYPFLDNDIVDFALGLPDELKIREGKEKYLLKEVAKRYLPMEIIERKKFPYRSPLNVKKFIHDYNLLKKLKFCENIFDIEQIQNYLLVILEKNTISSRDEMIALGIGSVVQLFKSNSIK